MRTDFAPPKIMKILTALVCSVSNSLELRSANTLPKSAKIRHTVSMSELFGLNLVRADFAPPIILKSLTTLGCQKKS